MRLKVLTLNIWQGGLLFDQVISFIHQEQPDVLCLQEVFNGHDVTKPRNYRTVDVLSQELPGYFSTFAAELLCRTEHGKFEIGNAVFSRFPILAEHVEFLGNAYGEYDEVPASRDWSDNPKNIQHCQIDIQGKTLNVFNLHGVWDFHGNDTPARLKMSQIIVEQTKEKQNAFLTGDFNVFRDTNTVRAIEAQLKNVSDASRKTSFNLKYKDLQKSPGYATAVVDFVFTSPDLKVLSFSSPEADVSDHLPLLTEIEL